MRIVRRLAFDGVPDDADHGLRALYWRLLLGLLPPERARWEHTLADRRKEYYRVKAELMADPHQASQASQDHVRPQHAHKPPTLSFPHTNLPLFFFSLAAAQHTKRFEMGRVVQRR
jgi:hypothetical protein